MGGKNGFLSQTNNKIAKQIVEQPFFVVNIKHNNKEIVENNQG